MPARARTPPPAGPPAPRYFFTIRWREEVVCACDAGSFALEMPGHVEVLVPSAAAWAGRVPAWAQDHRPAFLHQLAAWCPGQGARFVELDDAWVFNA